MSSSSFDATLDLAPRPSAAAHRWLFGLHVLAVVGLMALPPGGGVVALALGVAGSWAWVRRHPAFGYGPRALARLTWHGDGRWTLRTARGDTLEATLRGDSVVHRYLLVLNFDLPAGGRRTRVLLGDELDADALRRLRARLAVAGVSPA